MRMIISKESDGLARLAGPTSPTNPVRVHLNGLGHVVVDDQGHVLDVDTSTSHVGGHKNILKKTIM